MIAFTEAMEQEEKDRRERQRVEEAQPKEQVGKGATIKEEKFLGVAYRMKKEDAWNNNDPGKFKTREMTREEIENYNKFHEQNGWRHTDQGY